MTTPHHKYTKLEVELIEALTKLWHDYDYYVEPPKVLHRLGLLKVSSMNIHRFTLDFDKLAAIKKEVENGKE